MFADTVRRRRSTARLGRLLALLVAAAFLLTGLTGNSFSLHVGTIASSPVAAPADNVAGIDLGMSRSIEQPGGVADDEAAVMPVTVDIQHLMHLLGACLAVLAVAAVLLGLRSLARALAGGCAPVTAFPDPVLRTERWSWSPPAPFPPRSSPVIRT